MKINLDVKDRKIVHQLEINARQPTTSIGKKNTATYLILHAQEAIIIL